MPVPNSHFWRIEMLGTLRLTRPEQTITRFQTHKNGALLAYLAYHLGNPISRELLLGQFWESAEWEQARNSLRVALASLRKQLELAEVSPNTILSADRYSVCLNKIAVTTDVAEFIEAMEEAQSGESVTESLPAYLRAIQLYQGELLPGWYEEWVVPERSRLLEMYITALQTLVQHYSTEKQYEQAVTYSARIIQVDSLRESAYRNLMRLYAVTGRPANALYTYQQLEEVLREALNVAPSVGTRDLMRKIKESMGSTEETLNLPVTVVAPPVLTSEVSASLPPAPIAKERQGYVPPALRRFFGREQETASLCRFLTNKESGGCRLMTLTGTGGVGKTRLSQEVARQLLEHFGGGVWFVSLAELTSAETLLNHIAQTLQITPEVGLPLEDQIVGELSQASTLLVLDNFERLVEDGKEIVSRLLEMAPDLFLLITSQRKLDIPEERELPLAPLPLQAYEGDFDEIRQQVCVRLFVDRVQEARPDFQINATNAPVISQLCSTLEGIPLAIELAAAWSQLLTPAQMLERMEKEYTWLVNPRKGGNQRHRTLQTAIAWSYNLLDANLQDLFCQLSVFVRGCTLDAVQEILAPTLGSADPMYLEAALRSLCQRSLLFVHEEGEGIRFWMLEAVRQFAQERLEEQTNRKAVLVQRHAEYYLRFSQTESERLNKVGFGKALDRLQDEIGNIRSALEYGMAQTPLQVAEVMSRLWYYFYLTSDTNEGQRLVEQALLLSTEQSEVSQRYAFLLFGAGRLNEMIGDRRAALRHHTKAHHLWVSKQDVAGCRLSAIALARMAQEAGDFTKAVSYYQEVLSLYRNKEDIWNTARLLRLTAQVFEETKDWEEARSCLVESRTLFHLVGDRWGERDVASTLAQMPSANSEEQSTSPPEERLEREMAGLFLEIAASSADLGDYAVAYQQACMSLEIVRTNGLEEALPFVLEVLGGYALQIEDYRAAYTYFDECLTLAEEIGDIRRIQSVEPRYQTARAKTILA